MCKPSGICSNGQSRAALWAAPCLVAALVLNSFVEASAQPVDQEAVGIILQRQAYNVQAIEAVAFQGKVTIEKGDGTAGVLLTFSFLAKRSMYRAEFETGSSGSQSRLKSTNAFDGKFFQSRTGNSLVVGRTIPRDRPILMYNPLFLVYGFALDGGDFPNHLGALCESSFFTRLATHATALMPATWGNRECEVLTFVREHPILGTCKYDVYFAKDLGYFPVRTRQETVPGRSRGVASIDLRVLDVAQFGTPDGSAIVIPARVESSGGGALHNGKQVQQSLVAVVDVNTLRVNQPVQDDAFRLVVGEDDHVYDADLGVYIKSGKKGIPPNVAKLMMEDVEVFGGRNGEMKATGNSPLPTANAPAPLDASAGNAVSAGTPVWRNMVLVLAGILAIAGAYLCLRKGKQPR